MKSGSISASSSEAAGGLSAAWEPLARALWSALTDDVRAEVLVVTPQGKVVFANHEAQVHAPPVPGAVAGSSVRELYADAVANERLGHIAEVARTGRPVVLEGIVRGAWRVTSLRLLPTTDPLVLQVESASAPTAAVQPRVRLRHDDLGPLANLTSREREILALIGRGLSTVEIAEHLGRSVKTIEWHRVSLGTKLGVANRVELAHIALRAGLAQIEVPQGRSGEGIAQRTDGRRKAVRPEAE